MGIKEIKKKTLMGTTEIIIDLVRTTRNDIIKALLEDDNLLEYINEQYSGAHLSKVQRAFLERELKELSMTPVDLVHYAKLITEMQKSELASPTFQHRILFQIELDKLIVRYLSQ